MKFTSQLPLVCILALSGPAFAQGINVDCGIFNAVPSSSFGAAAAQPGVWNQIDGDSAGPFALVGLAGAPSAVTITQTSGTSTNLNSNNLGTSGDDELLMDDIIYPAPSATWTINGLAAGSYDVYTYAWAPDSPGFITGVVVNGSPQTDVGGAWPGGYSAPITHALNTVTISAGAPITLTISAASGYASFDGFQLRPNSTAFSTSCSGDGSGTACPCGNAGIPGRGCGNGSFASGAELTCTGIASIGADSLILKGFNGSAFGAGLYFQGSANTSPAGTAFGHGIVCMSGSTPRLEIVNPQDANGASQTVGILHNEGGIAVPGTYSYQWWYRDAVNVGTCSTAGSAFNFSNAITLTWGP